MERQSERDGVLGGEGTRCLGGDRGEEAWFLGGDGGKEARKGKERKLGV